MVPAHLVESVTALCTGQPLYLEGRLVGTTDTDTAGHRHRRVFVVHGQEARASSTAQKLGWPKAE